MVGNAVSHLLTKKLLFGAYYTGLFWFSRDYQSLVSVVGMRNVSKVDILKGSRVDPVGLHAEHSAPRDLPRGRVYFDDRKFKVWVGEDCPLSDAEVVRLVRPKFGLCNLDSSMIKVKRHYHWNTKDA